MGMIAKKIIEGAAKGLGGAFSGAAEGMQSGNTNILGEKLAKAGEKTSQNLKNNKGNTSENGTDSSGSETGSSDISEPEVHDMPSDEELKNIYGDAMTDSLLENFSKIAAINFTYKPEAQAEYKENPNVDDKEHIGVIAQELESNPVTASTVETDENGHKVVNTDQLAMADTAVIAEMSRRILTLEVAVKELLAKTRG